MSTNINKIIVCAAIGYGISTIVTYKYSQFAKAQKELREVTDQKKFLYSVHQKFAERYDKFYEKREFSNKISKYRRTLLTYATGQVLEIGVGTAENMKYYTSDVEQLIGVDWSDNMLLKAFEKIEDLEKNKKLNVKSYKLLTADAHDLPFTTSSFDSVVATFVLESVYDHDQVLSEIKRVCKHEGKIIIISRGESIWSVMNQWLQFKAARDLMEYGVVEHLDISKIIEKHKDLKVFHQERRSLGMTYVYILEVDKENKVTVENQDIQQSTNEII